MKKMKSEYDDMYESWLAESRDSWSFVDYWHYFLSEDCSCTTTTGVDLYIALIHEYNETI